MSVFEVVKFAHVLSAIIAVGFNASYGILIRRAAHEPEHMLHVLETIRVLDQRFANVGYGMLLATGIWMVLISPFEITEFWILAALVLYVLATIAGIALYAPIMRRQLAILQSEGPSSQEYAFLSRRAQTLGVILVVMVVAIVFLMVTKPRF